MPKLIFRPVDGLFARGRHGSGRGRFGRYDGGEPTGSQRRRRQFFGIIRHFRPINGKPKSAMVAAIPVASSGRPAARKPHRGRRADGSPGRKEGGE